MKIQYLETLITVTAYTILLYNLNLGLLLILLSNTLNAISRAYFVAYSTLIDDLITCKNANNRTTFYAKLDFIANKAAICGTAVNALIYFVAGEINVNKIHIYYFFCCFYALTKIIDLICSIIEKKEIDKLIKLEEEWT
ncbi:MULTISPECIES: hypothetical protein [unclassified Fusobacterium]|nr:MULTISPECIES: hypothetical protein [unclassified Fusobacterium]